MERAPATESLVLRYALAVGLVAAATGLSFLIRPLSEGSPFILYFLAAILAARFGGLGAGALAIVTGAVAALYFFIAPRHSFFTASPAIAFELVGFVLVCGVACWIASALGMAQERLRRVVDSIWEGLVVVDAESRPIYVNHQAAEFMEKRLEDVIGKPLVEVFPELPSMPFFAELRHAMFERRPSRIEAYFPAKDAWLEANVVPAEKGGLALFVRNVTERKRVQQQLEATFADLARSNHELERFASTVSHDWVQPLSSIMTNASLLEYQDGETRRYARRIIDDVHRMSAQLRIRRKDSKAGALGRSQVDRSRGSARGRPAIAVRSSRRQGHDRGERGTTDGEGRPAVDQ